MVFNLRTFSFAESVEDDPTPPKTFSLKELRVATHNFSRDNFFSERVFGTLYWGRLADGSLVAVKRARTIFECSEEQFETEVQVGRSVSAHQNVLRLRGFCRTKKELLLVYPLMINKNLRYHLRLRPDRSTQPLGWTTRMCIALGAARGLAYLHNQGNVKIMHRDICTSSIFLNERFEATIGNFWRALIMHDGNAKEGTIQWPARVSSSSQGEDSADSDSDCPTYRLYEDVYVDTTYANGRVGFIAPEYLHTGKCTLRNDVHAFGKVLLELISGQPSAKLEALAYDENLSLEEWIGGFMNKNELERLIDPNLQGNYVEEEAEQLLRLALLCADGDPSVRLEMSEVVQMLESQLLGQDPSSRSSWSQSECDSTPYYSIPPSPSEMAL
ncbi:BRASSINOSTEROID INSENSITIVE 1-associated receptor kinase 1-like [Rhodamnia argentea]|uniref:BRASSINOSTEROID INSENSITIVE 1-associated receptor kinase 1-like n=1 Tax=Rhodamnia argentea TaxID=178133 RepID=A0ABM3HPM5_9MYRT|nr:BRASSINOSTEROID INSENSITIVE 1-associated receptor kinase 1-like [Rhodamnia argentea]